MSALINGALYRASLTKRHRATKADVERRRQDLYDIIERMYPMTVRQVFYQATVRGIVDKSEADYNKVQTDLVVMRRADVLPYDWLADNTRWQRKPRTFDGVREALPRPSACIAKPFGQMRTAMSRSGSKRTH